MNHIFENVDIKSIATCLPKDILEMTSLVSQFGENEVMSTIANSGIERLHVSKDGETTSDLCFEAAEQILQAENVDRSEIDGLVFVSQSFDYLGPATSCVLQGRLGLSKECVCFDISYGCSGYIYGVFQAVSLISSGACKNVLMLAGETGTKLAKKDVKSSVMVFGDAGSATLFSKGTGRIGINMGTDGYSFRTVLDPSRGYRYWPANLDKNFELDGVGMNGEDVFSFIVSVGPKSMKSVLELMGWDANDVDFYALHQATKITIDFLRRKLKLKNPERAPFDIQNYGNTGPCTVPMVLTDWPYRAEGIDTSTWHKVIMSAYGIGLSWGSIACDLSKTHIYRPINQ